MTRDLAAEWRGLLASGRARWCPGMRDAAKGARLVDRFPFWWSDSRQEWVEAQDSGRIYLGGPARLSHPDFDDPATLGCLLGLVREAWGDPGASSVYQPAWDTEPARWCVAGLMHGGWRGEFTPTEAAALLSALAAAPVRT